VALGERFGRLNLKTRGLDQGDPGLDRERLDV
jgi:hypothetical protein